ncbi:MAG TPA: hypothetical protein VF469_28580 [Kofleriaceae bacterium]
MFIDTNPSKNWNPYRALAITGAWLALVVLVAVVIGNGCGDTPPAPTNGSITLSWSITDLGGKPLRCAQVVARSVALRLHARAGGRVVATTLPCEATPGTAQVPSGVYDVAIELHAADGRTLATAPEQTRVAIAAGQVKRLLPVTFVVRTQGPLPATPTMNCQPVEAGDAGGPGTALTPERSGGGCAAVRLVRMLGSAPSVAGYVEKTEALTISGEPGTYLIRGCGELGAIDGWQRDDLLAVPPPNKPLTHTVGPTRQSPRGC